MKLNPMFFISSLVVIGLGLIFSGCDVIKGFGIGTSAQYSLVPTEGLTTDAIPQEDFFYVNLSASYYYGEGFDPLDAIIYAMDEGPGTDCKISVNEDSTEDLYCLLDVMEGDLFFHKLVLEYNVPPEMCAYSGFLVPYHFNQEIVKGPDRVSKCKFLVQDENDPDENTIEERYCGGSNSCNTAEEVCLKGGKTVHSADNVNSTCDTEAKCESANCGNIVGTWSSGVCRDNENNDVTSETNCNDQPKCEDISNNCGKGEAGPGEWHVIYASCQYGNSHEEIQEICGEYNKSEQDLGNCCLGSYDLRQNENDDSSNSGKWGGDFKECIGGPGRFAWDSYNKAGEPITEVTNTGKDGLKDTYELDAIINVYDGRYGSGTDKKIPSFINANHWEDAEDKEFLSSESKLKVYFSEEPPKPFIKNDIGSNPYFVWTCMDRAKEVKHRIILMVREWNTQKEYNRFKESLGSSGDPDIAGEEGSLCDYFTSDEKTLFKRDSDCNDLLDLDDWEADDYGKYPRVIYKDSG